MCRYNLLQWSNFYRNFNKRQQTNHCGRNLYTIYRSLQGIRRYKIVKLKHSLQMQIITHFVKFKPKYKLEKISKFKFNKGTIATHSTIGDSQHRVILTFLTFLLSVALTLLALSHNTCHLAAINCSFRLFCEKTALEVLNTHVYC